MNQIETIKKFLKRHKKKTAKIVQGIFSDEGAKKEHVLYETCEKLDFNLAKKDLSDLLLVMREAMHLYEGIGIASNQIGLSIQIFLIESDLEEENSRYQVDCHVPFQVFINPRITKVSQELVSFWHGCLSAVGQERGCLANYKWIEYEAYNEKLQMKTGRLEGLAAVIFQHEFCHLLGSLYVDKATCFSSGGDISEQEINDLDVIDKKSSKNISHLLAGYKVGERIESYKNKFFFFTEKGGTKK